MLQASTALSIAPNSAETSLVAAEQAVPLLHLEQEIQAVRAVVQAQQAQLQSLQSLQQSQPLVGLTTDQPWGMALEGLSLGLAALVLGGGALLALRTLPLVRQRRAGATAAPVSAAPAEFSDSMLYLADQDDMPEQSRTAPEPTVPQDSRHETRAATLVHEEGDPALEYHRLALAAQGVSVGAGAGYIDSDRIPLEAPPPSAEKALHPVFSPSLSCAEFDQRAAVEEVERVRRYLAQRRADRAQTSVAHDAGTPLPVPEEPADGAVWHAALEQSAVHVDIDLGMDALPPGGAETSQYTPLSDGASLLVALSDEPGEPAAADADEDEEPALPSAHVQMALAQEFRDLGLWDEAKARLQEVLEQPDDGQHAQAQSMLAELQQLAPSAPLREWLQEGDAPSR